MVLITTVCEISWQAFTLFETTSGWIYRNSYAVGSQVLFLFDDFEGPFEGNSHMHLAAAPKGTQPSTNSPIHCCFDHYLLFWKYKGLKKSL